MNENESFREKILNRVRSRDQAGETSRKRRITTFILIVDAIAVVLILFYFSNRNPEGEYTSTTFNLRGIEYRFSISQESGRGDHTVALSLHSTSESKKTARFRGSIAAVTVLYGDDTVDRINIGKNIDAITLLPGESKNFIEIIPHTEIEEYIRQTGDIAVKRDGSIFSTKKGVPFTAVINLYTGDEMSTSLKYWHRL